MRECGNCQLCCKLPHINETGKPENKLCGHACKEGCRIYAERPPVCRSFRCLWLDGVTDWPPPDELGLYIDQNMDFIRIDGRNQVVFQIQADPDRGGCHREERVLDWVEEQWLKRETLVLIRYSDFGNGIVILPPEITGRRDGVWQEVIGKADTLERSIEDRKRVVQDHLRSRPSPWAYKKGRPKPPSPLG